jgi:sterol desaturase/sphingolipid hydroxylase (fatty acid hydroxylase superfamily)
MTTAPRTTTTTTAAGDGARATPRTGGTPRPTSLGDEARLFAGQTNPRIIAAALALAGVARVAVGGFSTADLWIVGALLAAQPFIEWVVHIVVLHYRPRMLLGRKIDFLLARKHREHHADPTALELIFVPLPVLLRSLPLGAVLLVLILPTWATALTAMVTGLTVLLAYEWTHYLIHSRYRPKSRLYRAIWRAHRLHHYKNEQYWFGVTSSAADRVLGTYPAPSEVPTSPTARTLDPA